jgi:membrane-bound serine protease (ClpP class)
MVVPNREALWKAATGREVKLGDEKHKIVIGGSPALITHEMTTGQRLLHYLSHPNIAALLMTLGLLLIYAEMNTPGIGLAGIGGALCLLTAFIAFQAIPIRTGGIILLFLGAALMTAEVFVTSGGALAVGGVVSFVLGLFWFVDPHATDLRVSRHIYVVTAGTLAVGTLTIAWAAAKIRDLSGKALAQMGGGDTAGLRGYKGTVQSVREGSLNGQILIRGELWEFQSGEKLSPGDRVVVSAHHGLKLEVKKDT